MTSNTAPIVLIIQISEDEADYLVRMALEGGLSINAVATSIIREVIADNRRAEQAGRAA